MRYFKVLHDFAATDVVELSVKKGDLVCAAERIEQDGWLKVELASDTRKKGFVPATYVREVSNVPSSGHANAHTAAGATTPSSFTNAALSYGEKAMGSVPPSPLHAAYGSASVAARSTSHHGAPQEPIGGQSMGNNFLANPNAVVEAFMKNEVYFKQLMKQRQDALSKLESGIAEALTDVSTCKDKNAILARKLRDLDVTIEKERKKWKDRVEEEKVLIQRAANSTSTTTTTSQQQHSTIASRSVSQGASRISASR